MPRLFVAIVPPASVRAQLIACQGGIDGARWQDDAQLHLTLRFVGQVDAQVGEDVIDALRTVRGSRFDIAMAGVGVFSRDGRAETLWAGVTPHEALISLHKKIDHALNRIGLVPDGRAYRPLSRWRVWAAWQPPSLRFWRTTQTSPARASRLRI